MIIFSPPVIMPYAPATQPIAKVAVCLTFNEATGQKVPDFVLFDLNNRRIVIDLEGLPQKQITAAQIDAFFSEESIAGETLEQSLSSRALPILTTCFGLSGGKVE